MHLSVAEVIFAVFTIFVIGFLCGTFGLLHIASKDLHRWCERETNRKPDARFHSGPDAGG